MSSNKNFYAVIMAGGVGSRFWPLSTQENPKQFHDILGAGETLIQKTFSRIAKIVPQENILILTNERYKGLVNEQLPVVSDENIVLEPAMRNTAPCILLAALKIKKQNPNAAMIVAPSDHWIQDEAAFAKNLTQAFQYCLEQKKEGSQDGLLVTLGIKPTFPHTGYGYIEYNSAEATLKPVSAFKEKPDFETAKKFLDQGNFLWNAGIFIWGVEAIANAFEKYLPEMYAILSQNIDALNTGKEQAFVDEFYPTVEDISIDYGILEKSENVGVIPALFDWNDLGAWGALYDNLEKNQEGNAVVNANVIAKHSGGNLIRTGEGKIVVVEGLNDFIIVDKDDVLLIMPKSQEQRVKEMRGLVKEKFGDDLV